MAETYPETSTDAANLSDLVNPAAVRAGARRLFTGEAHEIIGELLQNAQRAGARRVEFTTLREGEDCLLTVRDDGHGLTRGAEDFHTLLQLGGSFYPRPEVAAQHPLGLGLMALLAHEQVRAIEIASGQYLLALDTHRFWNDDDYAANWRNQLVKRHETVHGLLLRVRMEEKLIAAMERNLRDQTGSEGPARGYQDLLEVSLNGEHVNTSLPPWARIAKPIVETYFEGNRLQIGDTDGASAINWYGQMIYVSTGTWGEESPLRFYKERALRFYLEVRHGRPVDPLAPTRRGIIENEKFTRLLQFIEECAIRYAREAEERGAPLTPEFVALLYQLYAERARRELPVFVVAPAQTGANDGRGALELARYDAPPLLVADHIYVVDKAAPRESEGATRDALTPRARGVESFSQVLDAPPYFVVCGDESRLAVKHLVWRPGAHLEDFFYEAGQFALVSAEELKNYTKKMNAGEAVPELDWRDVSESPVWAFERRAHWSITDVEALMVGLLPDANQPDGPYREPMIDYLTSAAWETFDPEDDTYSSDDLEEHFEQELKAYIRQLRGDVVPYNFQLTDLLPFFRGERGEPTGRIESVEYLYDDAPQRPGSDTVPQRIRVRHSSGRALTLHLQF